MTSKEILYQAAELKLKIANLEAEYDLLKPSIDSSIRELATDEKMAVEVGEFGKFAIEKGPTKWKYTPRTEQMAQALKEKQEEEKKDGSATGESIEIIKFYKTKQ